jgi:hypothetical protein
MAINLVLPKDEAFIKSIQDHFNTQIDEMPETKKSKDNNQTVRLWLN